MDWRLAMQKSQPAPIGINRPSAASSAQGSCALASVAAVTPQMGARREGRTHCRGALGSPRSMVRAFMSADVGVRAGRHAGKRRIVLV